MDLGRSLGSVKVKVKKWSCLLCACV